MSTQIDHSSVLFGQTTEFPICQAVQKIYTFPTNFQ